MATEADKVLIATSPNGALPTWERLSCGFVAGAVARTATSPLDVVKLCLQVSSKGGSAKETIDRLWKEGGIAAFWRGNTVAIMNQGPQSAIKFFCVDELTRRVAQFTKAPITTPQRAMIGGAAGIISQLIAFPFDLIHTRITVDPKGYTGMFQAAKRIVSEEGVFALWSGIIPTITGAVVYEGSQYVISGGLKERFIQMYAKGGNLTPWQNLFVGAAAGAIGQTISFPFDVIRKRMMVNGPDGKKVYKSMGECFAKTWANEGVAGFFRGIGLNMVKIVPYSALQFMINEEAKLAFERFNAYMAQKDQKLPELKNAQKKEVSKGALVEKVKDVLPQKEEKDKKDKKDGKKKDEKKKDKKKDDKKKDDKKKDKDVKEEKKDKDVKEEKKDKKDDKKKDKKKDEKKKDKKKK